MRVREQRENNPPSTAVETCRIVTTFMRVWLVTIFILVAISSAKAETNRTLHILAFDCVQAQAEQRLADTNFTAKSGIKVVIERRSSADIMRQLDEMSATTNSHYDLVEYDNPWLGALVTAGLLERLDTLAY